jgi:hypothetical protein
LPLLAEGRVDEWSNSANRSSSLGNRYTVLIVGGWRKEGGKVKFVDKKVGPRI